jgi:excisionase family DNA binding protein
MAAYPPAARQSSTPAAEHCEPLLLSIDEAAHLLNIGKTTLYALINSGEIVSFRIAGARRIPRRTVDQFIAGKIATAGSL